MKTAYHKYIVILIIGLIGFTFHFKSLNEFPQYKHSWAQCDRYALALGFLNNSGDFFHPETYILNNQFPGDFSIIRNTSITSVDFPIHDYMASLLMRLFDTTDPWCFRVYILLYSIVGLFFLYRLATLFTTSFSRSLTVVLFAASSPLFIYYQPNFLPTIPSIANSFIGLYFFFNYLKDDSKSNFIFSLVFITLAVLARLPFAIILVAIICFECFYVLKHRKIHWYKFLWFAIFIGLIVIYYMYNMHLRKEYGSLFLNYIIPAKNFNEFVEFVGLVGERWVFKFFSHIAYILLGILILFFIINKLFRKLLNSDHENKLVFFVAILFVGCILYFLLMTFQFLSHDYYFLDTFYLPFVLLFLFFVIKIPNFLSKGLNYSINTILLIVFIPVFMYANEIQNAERTLPSVLAETPTAQNFKNANELLDLVKIPADAKILVMGADGPNMPLILMRRKGFYVIYPDSMKIARAMKWPFDYAVLENSKIDDIYNYYPEVINQLERIASNEGITIYQKRVNNKISDFDSFFELGKKTRYYYQRISFDTIPENCFGVDSLSAYCYSGKKASYVNENIEWGFTHRIFNSKFITDENVNLVVTGFFSGQKVSKDLSICVSIKNSKKEEILFKIQDISSSLKNNSWVEKKLIFSLPKIIDKETELTVFVWNRAKNVVYYDDLEISLYQQ